ncbi:hypothetical protein [Streptomyces sp. SP18CS02]|uniref:hypothetical protein n=1 Tax=Streptomyces sp. SP18CS02 TaxID=3002531 RepID=UPI002E788F61|nr:hypothetical protein [Streptomyces sp. SP18CS02]MEE1755761.1 hypothetical protein [Streptomyces sp. SP18CS02]
MTQSVVAGERHPSAPGRGAFARYGGALLLSMGALFVEAVIGFVVLVVAGTTRESPNVAAYNGLGLFILPILLIMGAFAGFVVSSALVLPSVALGGRFGRRITGREARWGAPAAAAALVALPTLAVGVPAGAGPGTLFPTWLVGTVAVGAAALVARPVALRRPTVGLGRAVRRLAVYGALAVVGTGALGGVGLCTGLIEEYRPPSLSRERAVGTWSDGEGGTLRLAADGTATAAGIDEHTAFGEASECSGRGSWSYASGRDRWDQEVSVSVEGCEADWIVGGESERPKLYVYIGDPDSWNLYELTKNP